jgi:uncharacterized protein YjhX (UPF0386 family)
MQHNAETEQEIKVQMSTGEKRTVTVAEDGYIKIETYTEDGWLDLDLDLNGNFHVYDERSELANSEGGYTNAKVRLESLAEICEESH